MTDCIFCQIVAGQAPASFVHRDELVSAFLVLQPVTPGHLLVIPNEHVVFTHDLPVATADRLFAVARLLARSLRQTDAVRGDGTNLFVADGEAAAQEVFHAHLHVIPRFPGDGFVIDAAAWRDAPPTRAALNELAGRIGQEVSAGVNSMPPPVATAAPILVEIFKHHRWANERLVEACASLDSHEMDQTSPGTYGSIRDTIVHLLAAEERFLELLGEQLDGASLREHEQSLDLDELRRRASRSGELLVLVAQRASGAMLARGEWRGEPYAIPVSILMTQVLNHASEHRSQVATVLGAHGITPPALDAWSYGPPELWKFR